MTGSGGYEGRLLSGFANSISTVTDSGFVA